MRQPLAALVHAKTGGNPFFVLQLLRSLHQDGLLVFDRDAEGARHKGRGAWRWDLRQIEAVRITGNVIDLLVGKVQKLPEQTQAVLKLAACIGSRFDSRTLAIVYERSARQTARALWEAVREGLILPVDQSYKLLLQGGESGDDHERALEELVVSYEFLHDRVQQAAYLLIPEARRKQTHLTIGRLLRQGRPGEQLGEQLFEIVNHLNAGAQLVTEEDERRGLAELNLLTGRKAKASTAYETGLSYLAMGTELLGEEGWQRHHALTFALHLEQAECEYLTTRFTEADRRFELLLGKARTDHDRVAVYTTRVVQFLHLRQYERAVETGVLALRLLGIRLSANPGARELLTQMLQVRWQSARQEDPQLISSSRTGCPPTSGPP